MIWIVRGDAYFDIQKEEELSKPKRQINAFRGNEASVNREEERIRC